VLKKTLDLSGAGRKMQEAARRPLLASPRRQTVELLNEIHLFDNLKDAHIYT
jgi:hypothetical protein